MNTIAQNDMRMLLAEFVSANLNNNSEQAVAVPTSDFIILARSTSWYKSWNWHDGILDHYVPPGWILPSTLTITRLCLLWFFGDMSTG